MGKLSKIMINQNSHLRVGIIVGGTAEELNDSIISAYGIGKALEKLGAHIEIITFDKYFERSITYAKVDVAIITDSTFLGTAKPRDLRIILEKFGISYSGSRFKAARITKNKILSKKYFRKIGLLTPKWLELKDNKSSTLKMIRHELDFPIVIKPRDGGSGTGVKLVYSFRGISTLINVAISKHGPLVAEEYMEGKEITVPVLEINGTPVPLAAIEIDKSVKLLNNDFKRMMKFTPELDQKKFVRHYIPPHLDNDSLLSVLNSARIAHEAIGCRGFSRVDMIVDKNNLPYLLEINSLPCLSQDDYVAMAASYFGLSYDELILNILVSSLK